MEFTAVGSVSSAVKRQLRLKPANTRLPSTTEPNATACGDTGVWDFPPRLAMPRSPAHSSKAERESWRQAERIVVKRRPSSRRTVPLLVEISMGRCCRAVLCSVTHGRVSIMNDVLHIRMRDVLSQMAVGTRIGRGVHHLSLVLPFLVSS